MAGTPVILSESQSWNPVLDTMKSEGYTTCVKFPRQQVGRVCMAIGCGLMKHLDILYPKVRSFLEKTWRKNKVAELVQVREKYAGPMERHFADAGFWGDVKAAVVNALMRSSDLASEKLSDLTRRGDLNIEDQPLLRAVCDILVLHLVIYHKVDNSYRQKSAFHPTSNNIGLVVVLFQESDWVCLLLHRDLAMTQGDQRVPFYLSKEDVPASVPKPTGITDRDVSEQVSHLAKALAGCLAQIPTIPKESLAVVLAAVDTFERFNSFAQRQFPFTEELAAIKRLSSAATGPHDLKDCRRFDPEQESVRLPCGNTFHTECLKVYLEREVEKARSTLSLNAECPVCGCLVAESVISDLCCSSYCELQMLKQTQPVFSAVPTPSTSFNSSSTQLSQSLDSSASFRCLRCQELKDKNLLYEFIYCPSRCQVCFECLRYAGHCPGCWRKYENREREFIDESLRQIGQVSK